MLFTTYCLKLLKNGGICLKNFHDLHLLEYAYSFEVHQVLSLLAISLNICLIILDLTLYFYEVINIALPIIFNDQHLYSSLVRWYLL